MNIAFSTNWIIEETTHWLAVNKPNGLIVEKNPHESPTLEEFIEDYLRRTSPQSTLGIVHRLDRVTSGVLLMAKKKSVLRFLNEQLREGNIQKSYLALVQQPPEKTAGMLEHWLAIDKKSKKATAYSIPGPGRVEARLSYRLLSQNKNFSTLEIQPATGRFHQIRAQLAAISCPIIGDEKYGGLVSHAPLTIALHAWKIKFSAPPHGQETEIVAPIPNFFLPSPVLLF